MSLRRAALVWMTVLLAVVGGAAVLIAYTFARFEAGDFLDGQLRQIALNAGAGLPESAGPAFDHDPEDEFVLTIWDAQGRKIHGSPPGMELQRQPAAGFADVSALGDFWRVYTSSDGSRTVQVAQRWTVREELATSAAMSSAIPILVVIPLSWLVIGLATDRLLRKLDGVAHSIATRSTESDDPIPIREVPAEVASLVVALNSLTRRLHAALEQQRRFVSDAAHELRTPLAALQIQADGLATADATTAATRREALSGGIRRASRLVDQLLRLARLGGQGTQPLVGDIDLGPVLLASVADHVDLALKGGVDIGITHREDAIVAGDADDLQILFDNLIGNAVRHSPDGGTVDISINVEGPRAIVEILDTGYGIPRGAEDRIFDRFFRAAGHGIEGTGLGLAIAAGIAERYGYAIQVANRADGRRGVLARVELATTTVAGAAPSTPVVHVSGCSPK